MKQRNSRRALTRGASLLCGLICIATAVPRSEAGEPLAVKVLIVNMFSLEAAPWVHALHDLREMFDLRQTYVIDSGWDQWHRRAAVVALN